MPIETAQFIDTLQPDWPLGTDPESGGDDHLRMIKQVLKNTLPNINGQITGTPTQINNITLNTPWQDNSATAGALSNFNLTDPSKTDGTLAAIAVAAPTAAQLAANPAIAVCWGIIQELVYPVHTVIMTDDNTNPANRLGFGTWVAVSGDIYGVGTVTDSAGMSVTWNAGVTGGSYRVQEKHIVAMTKTLDMDEVDPHSHTYTHAAPAAPATVYLRTDAESAGYVNATTSSAGGHTPTGKVAIGSGTTTSGEIFATPGYGIYFWRRTA
ncbi:TPA: hypothetical protein ACNIQM_001841 [Citrobacter werkmanii]